MPKDRKPAKGFGQFRSGVETSPLFATSADAPRIIEIEISSIHPNPNQPRKRFDQESLRELANSIAANGLVQPITVSPSSEDDSFLLVAGERRLRAHRLLGRETIFAIQTNGDAEVIALIENIQREQLDPLEEADAYAQMMHRHGYSQAELGQIVGKKQNTISEALSLRRLSPSLVDEYRTSDTALSKSVLIEIAKEEDDDKQAELFKATLADRLGVRAVRARRTKPSARSSKSAAASARKDRLIRSLAATLKRAQVDARVEDFPAGSQALERLMAIKLQLDAVLEPVVSQGDLAPSENG